MTEKPSPFMPDDFKQELLVYLENIRIKKDELDKRAYFKSKIMEGIFKIKPEFIDFDKSRVDLYYAGVLFETKTELSNSKKNDAFEEIKKYITEKRKNTKRAVITDGIVFEIYDPTQIVQVDSIESAKCIDRFNIGSSPVEIPNNIDFIFNKIYNMLYPSELHLEPTPDVLVPRLINLINILKNKLNDIEVKDSVKYKTWKSYVSIVFGKSEEGTEELYKRHALLYYITILITAKVMKFNDTRRNIVDGVPFQSRGIMNFIEPNNFFDFLSPDHEVFDLLDKELEKYDFINVSEEVFRLLYEELILPNERHDLGEFYTPSWLAKILVYEAVETGNETVLDPTCGSGTFIRLAMQRIKDLNGHGTVVGFDINPIAVVISRANYLIGYRNLYQNDPTVIPIFEADSLMPNYISQDEQHGNNQVSVSEFSEEDSVEINFDQLIGEGGKNIFYYNPKWELSEMNKYINNMKNIVEKNLAIPRAMEKNASLIDKIKKLEDIGKNGIWFYILKNIYTPYYYRRKVNIILGNPPWLTYHDVKDTSRQDILDRLYKSYNMNAGGRNKSNQDMAGFFITRSKEFLKREEGTKIAFVLTRSILNGDQYNGLRKGFWKMLLLRGSNKDIGLNISRIWDIDKIANPFRKPSCMVMFKAEKKDNLNTHIKGYLIFSKNKVTYKSEPLINIEKKDFIINMTDKYSGISSETLDINLGTNSYKNLFKEGASLHPRPYYFIDILEQSSIGSKVETLKKYTTGANKRTKKGSYKENFDQDYVPNEIIYRVVVGEDIDHFKINFKNYAVIPVIEKNRNLEFIFEKKTVNFSYEFSLKSDISSYLSKNDSNKEQVLETLLNNYEKKINLFEKDREKCRGDKFSIEGKSSSKMSVLERLNYNNELLTQKPNSYNYMVIYNLSGSDIRCAVIDTQGVIADYTTYYAYLDTKEEAFYLAGILNSKIFINLLRNTGMLSERHIDKKPFEIFFPKFESNNSLHIQISKLAEDLTEEKKKENLDNEKIETLLKEIDKSVNVLLTQGKS